MTEENGNSVRITNRELFDSIQETKIQITQLNGKLDTITERYRAIDDHEARLRVVETAALGGLDREARLRLVERRIWTLPTAAVLLAVISAVISAVGTIHLV